MPAKPPEVEEWVDEVLHRPLAAQLVRLLVRTPITPNQVTLLSAAVGAAGGMALIVGASRPRWCLIAAGLLFLSVILDCSDGQLARARGTSSTYGAILDGIADYVVGVAVGVGATVFMVSVYRSGWFWLLGLAGIASIALQSALFDHTKTRYIARVGAGYREREEDLSQVEENLRRVRSEGRWRDALLLWIYRGYTRAQHAALAIPPAREPEVWRAANRGRMRAWTWLGIGTHFALAYLLAALSTWWPFAVFAYFALHVTLLNDHLALLLALGWRGRGA